MIAGQGGIGVELLAQVPDLARVIVPVGGGGLISGIAIALKSQRPDVKIIGVQAETCAPYPASLAAGRSGGGQLRPDDRRRDRGQAARGPHAAR